MEFTLSIRYMHGSIGYSCGTPKEPSIINQSVSVMF